MNLIYITILICSLFFATNAYTYATIPDPYRLDIVIGEKSNNGNSFKKLFPGKLYAMVDVTNQMVRADYSFLFFKASFVAELNANGPSPSYVHTPP